MVWRSAYSSGVPRPLMRGVAHGIIGLMAPYLIWRVRKKPRLRLMMVATCGGCICSAFLHCVPWGQRNWEQRALTIDFIGICAGLTGHIFSWEWDLQGFYSKILAGAALLNCLLYTVVLLCKLYQEQEMLVALRGFSGMQLGLQLAMLVAAQRRMRTMPRVLASIGPPLALAYFRRFGAFDAEESGPLPVLAGVWSPHEWYHLMVASVHATQLSELHKIEAPEKEKI
ncbi:unnamed protein product [Durusdinium trenchii]|uniref:Post-GPI attachment to proteins factor 3 n=1 Tax=Durusdinium trenchii TaxID=1381693 RepID=A0ABP0L3T2_9DINO